jgi:colanic acid biosynthesis glycosyl transferase WcaI
VVGHPKIQFVLSGAGAARDKLETLVGDLPNITLLPLQPSERLNELLNVADIHLLPQRAEAESFALPSKLSGMLASGRPVIVQTDGGELARTAGECGMVVPPGDATAMGAAVVSLAEQPKRRKALGRAARRFAEQNLARQRILARYEQRLEQLVDGPDAQPHDTGPATAVRPAAI